MEAEIRGHWNTAWVRGRCQWWRLRAWEADIWNLLEWCPGELDAPNRGHLDWKLKELKACGWSEAGQGGGWIGKDIYSLLIGR